MAVLKPSDVQGFVNRQMAGAVGLLIYGPNETGVQTIVEQVVAGFGRDCIVKRMSAASVKDDTALLDEAFRSLSLLGGRELVIVSDADDAVAKTVAGLFKETMPGNFLLLIAGQLSKTSLLRKSVEDSAKFFALPVHELRANEVMQHVEVLLRRWKLRWSAEAAELFQSLCAEDLGMALREAEKLALFCFGQSDISVADVEAACGDHGGTSIDAAIDATLDGDFATVDRVWSGLSESDQKSLLPMLNLHLQKLQSLRGEADRMGGVEGALRNARPPVFFARKPVIARQLTRLDLSTLVAMQLLLETAVEQSRRLSGLSMQIVERLLFALCQRARTA